MKNNRVYSEDGMYVAVIISPTPGLGWSTDLHLDEIEFCPAIVEQVLSNKKDIRSILHALYESYGGLKGEFHDLKYLVNYTDLEIRWVREGTRFIIQQKETGEEYITLESEVKWSEA